MMEGRGDRVPGGMSDHPVHKEMDMAACMKGQSSSSAMTVRTNKRKRMVTMEACEAHDVGCTTM
jgi:hypothetical protein